MCTLGVAYCMYGRFVMPIRSTSTCADVTLSSSPKWPTCTNRASWAWKRASQMWSTCQLYAFKTGFQPFSFVFENSRFGDNNRFLNLVPEKVVDSVPTANYRPLRIGGDLDIHTTLEPPCKGGSDGSIKTNFQNKG